MRSQHNSCAEALESNKFTLEQEDRELQEKQMKLIRDFCHVLNCSVKIPQLYQTVWKDFKIQVKVNKFKNETIVNPSKNQKLYTE